jgi:hypothetical protein
VVGNIKRKRLLARARHKWDVNIKMYLKVRHKGVYRFTSLRIGTSSSLEHGN